MKNPARVREMLVLAIDTAGKSGGVALARGDHASFELIGTASLAGGSYSARLVPAIAEVLAAHQLSKFDVEGFAVASGPGSFTGLRVGLGAVKALAEALGKPIAAVSVLAAVAAEAETTSAAGKMVALLDAGRGEVYVGEFSGPGIEPARQLLLDRAALPVFLQGRGAVITPDEALAAELQAAGLAVALVPYSGPVAIARLGLRKLLSGDTVLATELDANYIRRSDAEIFSLPKLRP